jgi:hypothetical protein
MLLQTRQNLDRGKKIAAMIVDGTFVNACEAAGVKPSRRQAGKYLKHRGAAYNG